MLWPVGHAELAVMPVRACGAGMTQLPLRLYGLRVKRQATVQL